MELENASAQDWDRRVRGASGDWNELHKICRFLRGAPPPVRPLLHGDGTPRYKAEDRAQIFAEHLESQFRPADTTDTQHSEAVALRLRALRTTQPDADTDAIVFSPWQVRRALLKTKPRKAPGEDTITNAALRHLPHRAVAAITRLFNGIARTGHFPTAWKRGVVIMIPKPGKNTLKPESYRPITLLSCLSKIFERMLLERLEAHFTPRSEQFGFRSEHSTTLQLSRVLHHIAVIRNKREHAVAVFLDMEKAFDRVWHEGLLFKMDAANIPLRIIRVVDSFLTDRTFRVRVEESYSNERQIRAGVPQGSVLSPTCYSIYTDDIPKPGDALLALYADDAAFITASFKLHHAARKMQATLDALPAWLDRWRLSVNVGKTQALLSTSKIRPPQPLTLLGMPVPWKPTIKYLGVTIDKKLNMAKHAKNVVQQVRSARNILHPVLSSSLPLRSKVGVYKTYLRSRLTYAAPAWYAFLAEKHRKTLRAQQSLALRTITDAPRFVRNATIQRDLRVESLDAYIGDLATAMFSRADASRYTHLAQIATQHQRPEKSLPYPRELVARSSAATTSSTTQATRGDDDVVRRAPR